MTGTTTEAAVTFHPPQWSRPRIGRMTAHEAAMAATAAQPQWSRPRIGRMTPYYARIFPVFHAAAMEPAEDRPDDSRGTSAAGSWTRCRNGAGRGSAG